MSQKLFSHHDDLLNNTLLTLPLGSFIRVVVIGESMSPLIKKGDKVVIERVERESLRIGDIVAVLRNGIIFTHRFITHDNDTIVLKADTAYIFDAPDKAENFLGIVTEIEKHSSGHMNMKSRFFRMINGLLGLLGQREVITHRRYKKLFFQHKTTRILMLPYRWLLWLLRFAR